MTRSIGYKRRTPGSLQDVLSRAFAQAGGANAAADVLPGREAKRLYEAAGPDPDPKRATRLFYDEARLLTRAYPGQLTAFAEDLAILAGGVFLPPMQAGVGAIGAQAGRAGRESGEAMSAIYEALTDGVFTTEEAKAALPQIREVLDAYGDLYRLVQAIIDPPGPVAGEGGQ